MATSLTAPDLREPWMARFWRYTFPVGAGVKCWQGGRAVLDTRAGATQGQCIPAVAAPGLVPIGRFRSTVDNTAGVNGALSVEVELVKEAFVQFFNNSATNAITAAMVGQAAYLEDDNHVGNATADSATCSSPGIVWSVNATDGVGVRLT